MRRFVAATLVGLALLAGSVAWSVLTATASVFDRDGSERIADVLVSEPGVRDVLAKALGDALTKGESDGPQIPAAELDAITRLVLDDPRTLTLLHTAIVGAHQRIVGAAEGPVQLDLAPVTQAVRDALIGVHPELAASLPASPPTVELPTDKLPELAPLRAHAGRIGRVAGVAAVALLLAAFVIAADRPRILRRVGRWAVGLGAASVVMAWLVPSVISGADNSHLSVLGALGLAIGRPVAARAVVLTAAGAAAMVIAAAWRTRTATAVASGSPPADAAPTPIAA